MRAMILAAGLGTRLQPLTNNTPKALIKIGDKTLLQWQIEQLTHAGIRDITINVHHLAYQIEEYLHLHHNFDCSIYLAHEENKLLNTGGGVLNAFKDRITDEAILVLNVDIISNLDIKAFIRYYEQEDADVLGGIVVVSERKTERYLLFDKCHYLCGWTNRATMEYKYARFVTSRPPITQYSPWAFGGIHIITPRLFTEAATILQEQGEVFSIIDWYLSLTKLRIKKYVAEHFQMMDAGKIKQLPLVRTFMQSLQKQKNG